jgi:DNA-binding transcriptional MerR regulator
MDFAELATEFASVFENAASIVNDGIELRPADSDPEPIWAHDRSHLVEIYDSDEAAVWMERIGATYLNEAASEMVALAILLRAVRVRATLEPLVRAIVERMGHLNWVFDHEASLRSRVIRTFLEVGVSYQHIRMALDRLGASNADKKRLRKEAVTIREFLSDNFDVDRSAVTDNLFDLTRWNVEGESYPNFERAAHLALEASNLTPAQAKGSYAALSGFSHPSVLFSAEHELEIDEITTGFVYRQEDLEKTVALALFAFLEGVAHWVGYYHDLDEDDPIRLRLGTVSDAFNKVSVLG